MNRRNWVGQILEQLVADDFPDGVHRKQIYSLCSDDD